jgi:diacylglycerol kinase family enzyme
VRVTLIHNPNAGDGRQWGRAALLATIRAAGHTVRYCSSHDRRLPDVLNRPADLIAIAGGDGTVARIAKRTRGRDVLLTVLPIGTANNIANSLRLTDLPLEEHASRWPTGRTARVDIGRAAGPWGSKRFVEAFGLGLLPFGIHRAERSRLVTGDSAEEKVTNAVTAMRKALCSCQAVLVGAMLDGRDISGQYLVLQAMNISFVGPNLNLASAANPGDGLLDIVLVSEDERDLLDRYLAAAEEGDACAPALPLRRGRVLELEWTGFPVHIDDKLWRVSRRAGIRRTGIEITLPGDAVQFLLPH